MRENPSEQSATVEERDETHNAPSFPPVTTPSAPFPKTRRLQAQVSTNAAAVELRWSKEVSRWWSWLRAQPVRLQLLYGLVLIPALALLILLKSFLLPSIFVIFGALFAALKIAVVFLKLPAFIVYISYKVFKTLLGVYLTATRFMRGREATRRRLAMNDLRRVGDAPVRADQHLYLSEELVEAKFSLEKGIQRLKLSFAGRQTEVIHFSYLRYFLIGQWRFYRGLWLLKGALFTLWRAESRAALKEELMIVPQTIFSPQELGAHAHPKTGLLVPGDALLTGVAKSGDSLTLTFELRWDLWNFSLRPFKLKRRWRWARWRVELPSPGEQSWVGFSSAAIEATGIEGEESQAPEEGVTQGLQRQRSKGTGATSSSREKTPPASKGTSRRRRKKSGRRR